MYGRGEIPRTGRGHAETCAGETETDLQGDLPEPGERLRTVRPQRLAGGALRLRRGGGHSLRQPGRRPGGPFRGEAQVGVRGREADLHPPPRGGAHRRGREGGGEQDRRRGVPPGKRDAVPSPAGSRRGRQARQGLNGFPASSYPRFFRIRPTASSTFSLLPKAERRKNPSPDGPNPLPGVPTTWHSARSLSKKSHDESPPGVFSQMYGAFTPPYTVSPADFSPSRMTRAFPM